MFLFSIMLLGMAVRVAMGSLPLPAGSPFSFMVAASPAQTIASFLAWHMVEDDKAQESGVPQKTSSFSPLPWYALMESPVTVPRHNLSSPAFTRFVRYTSSPLPSPARPPSA